MDLQGLLQQKRDSILHRWYGVLLQDYPPETVRFLTEERDQFANPVGSTFVRGLSQIYDALVQSLGSASGSEARGWNAPGGDGNGCRRGQGTPREGTLREGTPREGTLRDALDSVIRIRATQAFPPSQAVAFVLRLKTLVREEADRHLPGDLPHRRQLAQWEAMVDALTLLAFDTYTQCREKMQEVRINELRNRTYRLLLKANVLADFGIEEAEQLRFGGEPPSAGDAGEGR